MGVDHPRDGPQCGLSVEAARPAGLPGSSTVPWGTSALRLCAHAEDALQVVPAFIAAGLAANERCVRVAGPGSTVEAPMIELCSWPVAVPTGGELSRLSAFHEPILLREGAAWTSIRKTPSIRACGLRTEARGGSDAIGPRGEPWIGGLLLHLSCVAIRFGARPPYRPLLVNRAIEGFGHPVDAFLEDPAGFLRIIPSGDADIVRRGIAGAAERGGPRVLLHRGIGANGQERRLRTTIRLVRSIAGLPMPTYVLDVQHRVISWNRACEAFTGVPACEVVGTDGHRKAIWRDDSPCPAGIALDGELGGRGCALGYRPSRAIPGGFECESPRDVPRAESGRFLVTSSPIRDQDGRIIAAVGTILDLTRPVDAEKKPAPQVATRTALLEAVPLGVCHDNPDRRIVRVDRTFPAMAGLPADQVPGRSRCEVFGPVESPVYADPREHRQREVHPDRPCPPARRGQGGGSPRPLYRHFPENSPFRDDLRPDRRLFHVRFFPIRGRKGVVGYLEVREDGEEAWEFHTKRLQSEKLAAIGTMVAAIAHEPNYPVTAVVGLASLLAEDKTALPSRAVEVAGKMLHEAERRRVIAQGLLRFSRAGDPIVRRILRLERLPADCVDLERGAFACAHIEVETELGAEALSNNGDECRPMQVFEDLLGNARQAMGGPEGRGA